MKDYQTFLQSKRQLGVSKGFEPVRMDVPLKPFQRAIAEWAVRRGRAAIFADTGLGKTRMQLAWADQVHQQTMGDVLILAPLAVASQTKREGVSIGLDVTVCRSMDDVQPGINITNYEMLEHFLPQAFEGVVLDESSLLKSYMGKTKRRLVQAFRDHPYRLACTATPAPNDHMELGNHAQFLGAMASNEMLARWFINDTMAAGNYRLKRHAERDFWRWVHSWAVSLETPSDLGEYDDEGYILPELTLEQHIVAVDHRVGSSGRLFRDGSLNATELHREMRLTAADRAARVAEIVHSSSGTWLVWCNTNYEADHLVKMIPEALEVRGSESAVAKERKLLDFSEGRARILITKPSLAGFGLNWQHCHQMAFVGLSYSYEQLYQAVRRCWRYGQTEEVTAHIVTAESEGSVLAGIRRKQADHQRMKHAMVEAMREAAGEDGAYQLRRCEGRHEMRIPDWLRSRAV